MPPRHVLVVDDDPSIQKVLVRMLQAHGFAAETASTIAEGVTKAEQRQADAVILDLGLKGGDESGIDLLGWLRQQPQYRDIPILILTGQSKLGEDDEALIRRQKAYVFYKPQPFGPIVEYLAKLTNEVGTHAT